MQVCTQGWDPCGGYRIHPDWNSKAGSGFEDASSVYIKISVCMNLINPNNTDFEIMAFKILKLYYLNSSDPKKNNSCELMLTQYFINRKIRPLKNVYESVN